MGKLTDWLAKPRETSNGQVMDNLEKALKKMKKDQSIKDQEGVDKEMEREAMVESAQMVDDIARELGEMEQEAEFEEIVEEASEETLEKEDGSTVEKGIFIFHDETGAMRHELFGSLSLENITFYNRYLSQIEQGLWDKQLVGEKDA